MIQFLWDKVKQEELRGLVHKWGQLLPVVNDTFESKLQHEIFVKILLNQFGMLVGNSQDLEKVLKVFFAVYKVERVSSEEVDKGIRKVVKSWEGNSKIAEMMKSVDSDLVEFLRDTVLNSDNQN